MTKQRVLALILLLGLTGAASARIEGMNQQVFEAIEKAQAMADAEDYDDALAILEGVRKRNLTSYETAQVLRHMGHVYYASDRFAESLAVHEEALGQPRLPESMVASLLGSMGRLALIQEDYDYAETRFEALLAMEGQNTPANRMLLASTLLQQEKYERARDLVRSAIADHSRDGSKPPENWLSALIAALYALEEFEEMRDVLRRTVELYPRERYLINLAALHGQLGDRQRQMALIESLRDDARLSQEAHLRMLADLFLAEGLAYKAAVLLQSEMDRGRIATNRRTLEQLSQAWYMAHDLEKALPTLERAASMAQSGELYLRLAGLHMDLYEWEAAADAASRALDLGGLRREGSAWLLVGMARVRLKQYDEAAKSFRQAAKFEESRRYSDQWLAYVANQRQMESQAAATH